MDLETLSNRILDTNFGSEELEISHSTDPPSDELGLPDDENSSLTHYGVPGMKWGVRKDRTKRVPRRYRRFEGETDKEYQNRMNRESQERQAKVAAREKAASEKRAAKERADTQRRALRSQEKIAKTNASIQIERERLQQKANERIRKEQQKAQEKERRKQEKQAEKKGDEKKTKSQLEKGKKAASTKGMTDEELRVAINRMNLEKQYREASRKPDKPAIKATKSIVAKVGANIATTYATKYAVKGIDYLIGKATGKKQETEVKTAKGNQTNESGADNEDKKKSKGGNN